LTQLSQDTRDPQSANNIKDLRITEQEYKVFENKKIQLNEPDIDLLEFVLEYRLKEADQGNN
jgi:hypothetical protein